MRGDRALDVRLGAEHGVRVVADQGLIFRVLNAHVVADPPVVQDRPAERRTAERLEAASLEELRGIFRVEVDGTDEGQVRVQVSLRDPDLRALRGEEPLVAPDVRPAAQQVGGNSHRNLGGRLRDLRRPLPHDVLDPARGDAQERRERARLLVDLGLEERHLRFRRVQERRRLCGIDFGHRAVLGAQRRDVEARALQLGVAPRHVELRLRGADADVVRRDLGEEGHEDVVVVGIRGEQLGIRGLDAAPELAPHVELPGDVETGEEVVEVPLRRHDEEVLARDVPAVGRHGVLDLGEERADRDASPCLGSQHPSASRLQRGVLPVALDDQVRQDGIPERFPPRADRLRLGPDAVRVPRDPGVRDRRRRTSIFGTDHHAPRHDNDRKECDGPGFDTPRVVHARRETLDRHSARGLSVEDRIDHAQLEAVHVALGAVVRLLQPVESLGADEESLAELRDEIAHRGRHTRRRGDEHQGGNQKMACASHEPRRHSFSPSTRGPHRRLAIRRHEIGRRASAAGGDHRHQTDASP